MRLHCFCLSFVSCALAACDPDWVAFHGSCYKLSSYPTELNGTILESRWECLRMGADLVKIKTEEEHVFITELIRTTRNGSPIVSFGVYIAVGDGPQEGIFQWFDGTPVGRMAKWFPPNPNNSGPNGISENCVRIKSSYKKKKQRFIDRGKGQWLDTPCLEPKSRIDSYLCQKPENLSDVAPKYMFKMLEDHYFADHHIGVYEVSSYIQCLTLCLAEYGCLSANVRVSGPLTDNCILNNATLWEDRDAMMINVTDYVNPRDWVYYEMEYPAFRI